MIPHWTSKPSMHPQVKREGSPCRGEAAGGGCWRQQSCASIRLGCEGPTVRVLPPSGHHLSPGPPKLDFPAHWWSWKHFLGQVQTRWAPADPMFHKWAGQLEWAHPWASCVEEPARPGLPSRTRAFESLILHAENVLWTCSVSFFPVCCQNCHVDMRLEIICCTMQWLKFEGKMNYKKLCY